MSSARPVILLTFVNDSGEPLPQLKAERELVNDLLRPYVRDERILILQEENPAIDRLGEVLADYRDSLAIFHYAGHASGAALRLEEGGRAQLAHADGLARFFRPRAGRTDDPLKLVFLNGCATRGQVKDLLDQGVAAVIATSAPVDDKVATGFSRQFYDSLAQGHSIGEAFLDAQALVASHRGTANMPQEFRGMSWAGKPEPADREATWGLYTPEPDSAVLNWTLPQAPRAPRIVRGETAPPAGWVNVKLEKDLLARLTEINEDFRQVVGPELRRQPRPDARKLRQAIIDAFPSPIGEQIRKLLSGQVADEARLRQLVNTYQITVKLFCFAMLAQLWDERIKNPDLKIAPEHLAALETFLTLREEKADTFDYFRLIVTVVRIFADNDGVEPVITESADLGEELGDDPSTQAHAFMEDMRNLLHGKVPADELPSFCRQAELHLTTILRDLAFVTRYKAVSIKKIELWRFRNEASKYLYTQVNLDGEIEKAIEEKYFLDHDSDTGSVILRNERADPTTMVNLTPFIIDLGVLDGSVSNLFFLSHHDSADDSYHFESVADPGIKEVVAFVEEDYATDDRTRALSAMKVMFDDFKRVVLGSEPAAPA